MGDHSAMRERGTLAGGSLILLLLTGMNPVLSQGKGPLDEDREILREIREAYKAPFEVHQDVLKDLRRLYQEPSEQRQSRILRELRRLYVLTPQREESILREIRRACDRQSPDQEERFFTKIASLEKLPEGALYLRCDTLEVRSRPLPSGKANQEMVATGRVTVTSNEFHGEADRVSYDEEKDQVIFDGGRGGEATLTKFKANERQTIKGDKIIYSRRTGEHRGEGIHILDQR